MTRKHRRFVHRSYGLWPRKGLNVVQAKAVINCAISSITVPSRGQCPCHLSTMHARCQLRELSSDITTKIFFFICALAVRALCQIVLLPISESTATWSLFFPKGKMACSRCPETSSAINLNGNCVNHLSCRLSYDFPTNSMNEYDQFVICWRNFTERNILLISSIRYVYVVE